LKNDVNVPSKSNKQKNFLKILVFVGVLKVNDENSRIWIRQRWAAQYGFEVRNTQFHIFSFVVRKTQLRRVSKFASALCAIPQLRILPLRAFMELFHTHLKERSSLFKLFT
jgi:hypothetical protein